MKPKRNFSRALSILLALSMLSGMILAVPSSAATTGWLSPTAGDNTGVGGSVIAADIPKAFLTGDSAYLNFGSNNERAAFYNFGSTAVPAGSTVTGIEVSLRGYKNNSEIWQISLSYDGGANWTSPAKTGGASFGSTDSTQIIGSPSDTWGYTPWTSAIINSSSFRVRLISDNMSGGSKLIALDHIQVRFTYTEGSHTVTWKTQDGTSTYETDTNVPSGTYPDYNGAVPTKAATAEFTYTFAGWSTTQNSTSGTAEASLPAVSGDVTYYAAFSASTNAYTVTWKTQDGTSTYETDTNVPYGTYPDYNGAAPTKAATAEFTYTFAGWSTTANAVSGTAEASLPAVSGDVTYYAAFSASTNAYTVTWKTQDGTSTYETDNNVPYGTYPDYNGAAPTKAATAEFTYTFAGWSTTQNSTSGTAEASLPAVSGDVTYYAAFSASTNAYTVTWKTQDGTSTYETDNNVPYGTYPDYNGATPTKTGMPGTVYTFVGWSTSANDTAGSPAASLPAVTGDVIYYAVFTEVTDTYTVKWKNETGTLTYETDTNVPSGTYPDYNGATPVKPSTPYTAYTFAGWSTSPNGTSATPESSLPPVTENVKYYAVFTPSPICYTVLWKNETGAQTYETDSVPYGTLPDYNGLTPAKAATAQYTYFFAGWSTEANAETGTPELFLPPVTGDVTYYAVFTACVNKYEVTWKNEAGTSVLESDTDVPYGTQPDYNGTAPAKAATAQYTYTFAGWNTEANAVSGTPEASLPAVTGNVTYYAVFTAVTNTYTVTWKNGNAVLETDLNVPYGTLPAYNGAIPQKAPVYGKTYTFAGWSATAGGPVIPVLPAVTGNATYYAVFKTHNYPFVFPILPVIPVVPAAPPAPPAPVLNLDDHFAYIVGYPDGKVRPGGNITREEAASVFFRLLSDKSKSDYLSYTNPFGDVERDRWSNTAISTLYNAGILKGDGGVFRPADKITRAELAAIIAHFAAVTENTVPLNDIEGHWAQTSIELAAGNGWIVGYTDGSFRPDQFITRAETMAMVNRALNRKVTSTADLLPGMKTWPDNGDPKRWYYFDVQEATNSHTCERKSSGREKWLELLPEKDRSSF